MQIFDAFESFDVGDGEVADAGPNTVIVHHAVQVHGRSSGANVEFSYSVVRTLRDGKILRDQWFADRAEAIEAAGLAE